MAPVPSASPSARQPQQSRPAPKPVWSARHLDGEAPRTRAPQPADTRQRDPSPASLRTMSGPEGWADGFQMPVPENGPATPFPEREAEDEPDAAPPLTGSGETLAEIEKEKTFVGEMLTRVFGTVPKKTLEPTPPTSATPQLAKAEDLAKATIADFATDKLRAPAVAQALHADKPFMDAITTSLETAMADRNAAAERRATEHAPSPEDEFPELPADDDSDAYDAPAARPAPAPALAGDLLARELSAASHYAAPPFAEPDMPRDLPEDLLPAESLQSARNAAAESPRASAELYRAAVAPPAPPPVAARALSQPESRVNAAASQAPAPASDALAFSPALEDSIKELIKPLIVQWLNDNLPRIVEKAVREEIADQGLVSRARGEGGSRR
jgi:cell pole-organizing protein PopZ